MMGGAVHQQHLPAQQQLRRHLSALVALLEAGGLKHVELAAGAFNFPEIHNTGPMTGAELGPLLPSGAGACLKAHLIQQGQGVSCLLLQRQQPADTVVGAVAA